MIQLSVNKKAVSVDDAPDTPLLWVLRDTIGLTGTKFGCGVGQCGACTVLVNGEPTRSCSVQVGDVKGKSITTIEGLGANGLTPVQNAWVADNVPQCGYCQSGMIMATTALLAKKPHATDAEIDAAITNVCRCGTYARVRSAIHKVGQA